MPHNPLGPVSTAACIHLGAAVPNFAYLEDNFSEESMHSQWDTTVFPKLLMRETTIERHATLGYPVPTDPGLGIEINEEALIAQPPFKHWNPPFLRRNDGSLNNW
jgi:galactonate dehydratase